MATATPTKRELVLKTLRSARRGRVEVNGTTYITRGGWVPGSVINTVGGKDGLRRLREIRSSGVNVEMRRSDTGYEYRLAK